MSAPHTLILRVGSDRTRRTCPLPESGMSTISLDPCGAIFDSTAAMSTVFSPAFLTDAGLVFFFPFFLMAASSMSLTGPSA